MRASDPTDGTSWSCPICHEPTRRLHTRAFAGELQLEFRYCPDCRAWAYLPLAPSSEGLEQFYADRFREDAREAAVISWPFERATVATRTKSGHARQIHAILPMYGGWSPSAVPDVRVLEVGCGVGHFLYALSRAGGITAVGVEFAGSAQERAVQLSGCRVYTSLEEAKHSEPPFDVVWAKHVIEHVPDPASFAQTIVSTLDPGRGMVVVECPNEAWLGASYSRMVSRLKNLPFCAYSSVMPPYHLIGHSIRSITRLFDRCGLKLTFWRTYARGDRLWFVREPHIDSRREFYGSWKEQVLRGLSRLTPRRWGLRENLVAVFRRVGGLGHQ